MSSVKKKRLNPSLQLILVFVHSPRPSTNGQPRNVHEYANDEYYDLNDSPWNLIARSEACSVHLFVNFYKKISAWYIDYFTVLKSC